MRCLRPAPGAGPKLTSPEWPETPTLRYLIYWALRRDRLCYPTLCPDSHADGERCDHCPLIKLDDAQSSDAGMLIRRALETKAMMQLPLQIRWDEIPVDEFYALSVLQEEHDRFQRESQPQHG